MADQPATGGQKGGSFGFLTKKLGPFPVWLWGVGAVGIYYWYTHYGPGAKTAAAGKAPAKTPRPQVVVVTGQPPHHHDRRGQHKPRPNIPAAAAPAPAAVPGDVATAQAPVYQQWAAAGDAVPDPAEAYAPMTAGSIYG